MNIHVQLFVRTHILCLHPGLNCWLITFNLLRSCRAIFQAAASFYNSTGSEWVFPFLHIHDEICYYLCFDCNLLLFIFLSLMTNVVEHPFMCFWVNGNRCLIIFSLRYLWYTLSPTSWGCGGREFYLLDIFARNLASASWSWDWLRNTGGLFLPVRQCAPWLGAEERGSPSYGLTCPRGTSFHWTEGGEGFSATDSLFLLRFRGVSWKKISSFVVCLWR